MRRATPPRPTCGHTCDRLVPPAGPRAGDHRADRRAADDDPAVDPRRGAALAAGARPAAPAAPALAGAAAPGDGEPHARRALRAVDRLRVRLLHPAAVLRADPLRHRAGVPRGVLP